MSVSAAASVITQPYTLFIRIPVFIDAEGLVYSTELWAHDLKEHLLYIDDLRLCSPVLRGTNPPDDWVVIPGLRDEKVYPLREDRGLISVAINLLPNLLVVAKAASKTTIAHCGLAGWAFPLSYYLLLTRPFQRFKWIVVMESSFWMKPVGKTVSLRVALRHRINLFLARACMRRADIRIFTQSWYRDLLLEGDTRNTLVNEAVWVKEQDVLSAADFEVRAKASAGPTRLLYPSRLVAEKGVGTLLAAIAEVDARIAEQADFSELVIDVIGSGPMEEDVRAFIAQRPEGALKVSFLDPVPYDAGFFELLSRYDAIIVANLMEEQPRIIYDGFSQGVPCIASRTSGVVQIVKDGETGVLFAPGSHSELADRLIEAARDRSALIEMGRRAIDVARSHTHEGMHRDRAKFLAQTLGVA